ncbi:MAG: CAP domain-containing protein [Tabrizicola sp.]|nr:CAP domain-containing protein [Tabrizicola sp.]
MSTANSLELYMVELINEERESRGLDPLTLNTALNDAAEDHSQWMLETDTFSHTGEGGSNSTARIADADFPLEGSWRTAENIAWGSLGSDQSDAALREAVAARHESLMNSPLHRANILNPDLEEIGVGIELGEFSSGRGTFDAMMVTQNFGTTDGDTSSQVDPGTAGAVPVAEVMPEPEMPEPEMPVVMEPVAEPVIDDQPMPVDEPVAVDRPVATEPPAPSVGMGGMTLQDLLARFGISDDDVTTTSSSSNGSTSSSAAATSTATVNPDGTVSVTQDTDTDGNAMATTGGTATSGTDSVTMTIVDDGMSDPVVTVEEGPAPAIPPIMPVELGAEFLLSDSDMMAVSSSSDGSTSSGAAATSTATVNPDGTVSVTQDTDTDGNGMATVGGTATSGTDSVTMTTVDDGMSDPVVTVEEGPAPAIPPIMLDDLADRFDFSQFDDLPLQDDDMDMVMQSSGDGDAPPAQMDMAMFDSFFDSAFFCDAMDRPVMEPGFADLV